MGYRRFIRSGGEHMVSSPQSNRPVKYGTRDRREYIVRDSEVTHRAQNDANGNVIYFGTAKIGTLTSEDKWQITFFIWDANNSLTSQTWPENSEGNATGNYEFVWDDRLTYTYS